MHALLHLLVSVPLGMLCGFTGLELFIFILVHGVTDFDHFIGLAHKKGKRHFKFEWIWNFKGYYTSNFWGKQWPVVHLFHTVEFFILLSVLTYFSLIPWVVYISYSLHFIEDLLERILIHKKRNYTYPIWKYYILLDYFFRKS